MCMILHSAKYLRVVPHLTAMSECALSGAVALHNGEAFLRLPRANGSWILGRASDANLKCLSRIEPTAAREDLKVLKSTQFNIPEFKIKDCRCPTGVLKNADHTEFSFPKPKIQQCSALLLSILGSWILEH